MKPRSNPFFRPAGFVAALTCVLFAIRAHATVYYWDNDPAAGFGAAGGTWGTSTNWSTDATGVAAPSVIATGTGDDINFGTSTLGLTTGSITVGTVSARAITFGAASGAITLSGGSITLAGNIRTSGTPTTTHTINSDIVLSGARTFGTSGSLANEKFIFGGNISGSGASLVADTANGSGAITLNGTNSFTGDITIVRGQLNVNTVANKLTNSSLGAGSKILMGGGGGQTPTLWYTGTSAGATNRDFEFSSTGTNTIVSQDAALTLSGTFKNTVVGTGILSLSGDAGGGANLNEVSGAIQDNGTSLIAVQVVSMTPVGGSAENGFWKLSGNNNYSGTTQVFGDSTLVIAHNNALGSTTSGTSVLSNAQLLLMGNIAVGAEALTLNSSATSTWNSQTGAALRNYSGNNSWAGLITLGQASTITTNTASTLTLTGGITGAQNLTFNSIGDTTVSTTGITTGAGTLTKAGAGTLTLSGTNTYTGTTTISAGTLQISGSSGSLGSGSYANTISIASGALLQYSSSTNQTLSGAITGAGALTKDTSSTSTLTISSASTAYTGATTVNAGTLKLVDATAFAGATTVGASGILELNSTNGTVDNWLSPNWTISGTGTINKTGTGWVDLRNANALTGFNGTLNIQQGTFGPGFGTGKIGSDSSTMTVNVSSGALFDIRATGLGAVVKIDKLTGSGIVGTTFSSGATFTVGTGGGSSQFDGTIVGNGTSAINLSTNPNATALKLIKAGSGKFTLTNTNTFTGGTDITAGTLQFGKLVSQPASGAVAVGTGATLAVNLGGTGEWTTGTSGNGTIGGLLAGLGGQSGGTVTYTGNVALGFDTTNAASTQTYSNAIGNVGTTLGITKLGTGTLTLSGTNTYTGGTTISLGSLDVRNSSALSSGNVSVAAGGKLVVGANNLTIANNITLNGTTTNGAIFSNQPGAGVTTNLTGQITLNATSNVSTLWNDKTLQLSGKITGVGGLDLVLQPGSVGGRYLITGATNDYAGATSVTGSATAQFNYTGQAMLYLGATNALPTTTALTLNYADLYLNGQSQTLPSISGSNTFSVQNGSTTAATLTLGSGNTTSTFSGTIKDNGISVTNTAAFPTTVTGTVALTKIGNGELILTNTNTYTGATTVNAGKLSLGHATDTLSSSSAITVDGATAELSIAGNSDMVGAVSLKNGGSITGSGGTLTGASYAVESGSVSAKLGGAGIALTKSTAGTVTLTGVNTYTGATTVTGGALNIGSSGSLNSGNALTVGASGTADFANASQNLGAVSNANTATNALNFSASSGTVVLASLTGSGNTRFGSAGTVTGGIATGTVTAVGALNANISGGTVTAGALLTGTISNGTVGAGSLSSTSVTGGTNTITGAAGITTLNGGATTVGGIATIGTMTSGTANLNGSTSAITTLNGGTVNLGTTSLTVSTGTTSGTFTGASGALTVTGALALNGNNSYGGVTSISAGGDLRVNGANSGSGAVNIASGAKLGGSGSVIGGINVSGILSPGNSIESLGGGALSFSTGSTYAYELNTLGLNGDLTYSSGTLGIATGTILTLTDLSASTALANGSKLTLISSVGAWNLGLFSYDAGAGLVTLADDSDITLGANIWRFNYNDTVAGSNFTGDITGATNYVTLTVVPEPNVAALLGGLGTLLLFRRRR